MGEQLTTSAEALRLFFTEDIYLVNSEDIILSEIQTKAKSAPVIQVAVPAAETKTTVAEVPVPEITVPIPGIAAPVTETTIPVIQMESPVTEQVKPLVKITAAQPVIFKYLGKNQKNILILVHDEQNDVSTDKGKELLRNIVKALQLTANDFALLNYAAYTSTGFEELQSFFKLNLVLSFGVSPSHLGMNEYPVNEIIRHGTAQLIFSANLDQLADDQTGKKTLWGSLKKLSI